MEVFGLRLKVQEEGLATVEAAVKRLRAELQKTAQASNALGTTSKSLASLGAGFAATLLSVEAIRRGVMALANTADTMALLEGRIRLVATSSEQLAQIQDKLYASSQLTRSNFASTAELYARLSRNSEQLGLSQADLLRFTELTQMSIRTSGINAIEASRGVIQLSQALASGVLRGDEFRAVMEQMPGTAQAIARGLGVPIGELRRMANEGELTAEKVTQAILKMDSSIRSDFSQLPVTIGDGMTRIGNAFSKAIADASDATGAVDTLGNALSSFAKNNQTALTSLFVIIGDVANVLVKAATIIISTAGVIGLAVTRLVIQVGAFALNILLAPLTILPFVGKKIRDFLDNLNKKTDANDSVFARMQEDLKGWREEVLFAERDTAKFNRTVTTPPPTPTGGGGESMDDKIKLLIQYNQNLPIAQRDTELLKKIEADLTTEFNASNTSLKRKVELQGLLGSLAGMRQEELDVARQRLSTEIQYQALLPPSIQRTAELYRLRDVANEELKTENLETRRKIQLLEELKAIEKALEAPKKEEKKKTRNVTQQSFQDYFDALKADMDTFNTTMYDLLYEDFSTTVGNALVDGLDAGLRAAIQSGRISDLWKVMSQTMLAQLANMMVNVALSYIGYAKMIAAIQTFLLANPAAAIATAAVMLAVAYNNGGKATTGQRTMSGGAGGISYGMSGSELPTKQIIFGATSATTAAGMTPRSSTNVTIIGPNDPTAQRALQELMTKADSRGRLG